MTASTGAMEWRQHHMLPIAAALGYATSVIHIYGLGPYIGPISAEFGWSRTLTTGGLALATFIQAFFSVPIGMAVDRMGPRKMGVIGVVCTASAFALLGTATGTATNWYALWVVMACATLPVQATVWTAAVASRFEASRGLAFAVTLCGASVAAALFPYLGTKLIAAYGWQTAMLVQASLWLAIAFPIIFFFFRGSRDVRKGDTAAADAPPEAEKPGTAFLDGLRSSVYIRLLIASLLFTFTMVALLVHFIPILTASGFDASSAAGIAALIGIFSIFGRLATGFMLDRFPGSLVGAGVFLLPVAGCLLLLSAGTSGTAAIVAACLIGLTLGAEVDVIVYLTTRHFGLRAFGALYGGLLAALSVGTASGPLGASRIFDVYGSYAPFLWITVGFMVASSLALVTLPRPAFDPHR